MKKILLCIMLMLVLTGCGKTKYREDISKTYKDYWDYSLGNYTLTSENEGKSWTNYIFRFNDINDVSRTIVVSNKDINDFNEKILYAANYFLSEDVLDIFTNKNIEQVEGINTKYDVSSIDEVKKVDEYKNLYDSTSGLKFRNLSLKNLNDNNIKITLYTTVELDGSIEDYPNLKDKLLSDVKFIFEDYDYQNIVYKFSVEPSDDWYRSYYILSYDGYNYNWKVEYLGDKNK